MEIKPSDDIQMVLLEAILMPNNEILSLGKSLGYYNEFKTALKAPEYGVAKTSSLKYTDFEDFLKEKHAEDYTGTDDDMPDAFDDWLGNLDGNEYMDYAEEWGKYLVAKLRNNG